MSFYSQPTIRLHDLTHTPVGLWQFQGDVLDSSGNGYGLTWVSTEAYTIAGGTVKAANFNGTSRLTRVSTAALQILGDVTVEYLASYPGIVGSDALLSNMGVVSVGAAGSAESANYCFAVFTRAGTTGLRILSQSGSGVSVDFQTPAGPPPYGAWHHFAAVRTSDVWTLFLNGTLVATSGTLTTPTGGTAATMWVASKDGGSGTMRCSMASLKIIASALTPAQVLAEARLCGFA